METTVSIIKKSYIELRAAQFATLKSEETVKLYGFYSELTDQLINKLSEITNDIHAAYFMAMDWEIEASN